MKQTAAPRHRSKLLRYVAVGIPLVGAAAYVGIGWYFSNQLLSLKPQTVEYDQEVARIDGDKYTMSGSAYDIDGIVGGIERDKPTVTGIFGPPSAIDNAQKTSTRRLLDAGAITPAVKGSIALQGNIWTTDPKKALNLDFQTVRYPAPLGPTEAWVVPPAQPSKTWTITVHGIGASKQEMLRFIKPITAAGSTAMVINYRGDAGNPRSPDGYNHLGDTEWQDVEAAVAYARAQGAESIQLYATSLGGSLVQSYLRRSHDKAPITKVVLDSPALNWSQILSYRVTKMGYPGFLSQPGMMVTRLRAGIHFDRITTKPGSLTRPTLIIHNRDDTSVPQAASVQAARAQPGLVQFEDFGSGGHIRAWNHDSERYEQTVTNFLKD